MDEAADVEIEVGAVERAAIAPALLAAFTTVSLTRARRTAVASAAGDTALSIAHSFLLCARPPLVTFRPPTPPS